MHAHAGTKHRPPDDELVHAVEPVAAYQHNGITVESGSSPHLHELRDTGLSPEQAVAGHGWRCLRDDCQRSPARAYLLPICLSAPHRPTAGKFDSAF